MTAAQVHPAAWVALCTAGACGLLISALLTMILNIDCWCLPMVTDFKSPAAVTDFDVLAEAFIRQDDSSSDAASVEVVNPAYEYIRPELISLFVTDTGGYTPSYVYRLLAEYYSREDYVLSRELADILGG